MKLIDLLSPVRKRRQRPGEIDPPPSGADRSSMAELVRLLQEHDEAQKESGTSQSWAVKR